MRSLTKNLRIERPEDEADNGASVTRTDRHHWVTPTCMISSFIAGVILAAAHHVYYARLNNTLVGSAARQQWPIRYTSRDLVLLCTKYLRFGTAFAFLSKTCLANATGIAYIQWVWRQCTQQAIQIRAIDAAFAVEQNIFMLFHPEFALKLPFAAGLMVIFWYFEHMINKSCPWLMLRQGPYHYRP